MSYQPGPDPNAAFGQPPPSHLTGFTVDSGFSVIPPKRPGTVTAASWMVFVYAGLATVATVFVAADAITHNLSRTSGMMLLLFDVLRTLLTLLLAVGFVVVAVLMRRGRDGGRVTTYVIVGAAALWGLSLLVRAIVFTDVPPNIGGARILMVAVSMVVMSLTATTIVLLATSRADAWFHKQRGEKFLNVDSVDDPKPHGPLVAAVLLGLIAIAEVVHLGIRVMETGGPAAGADSSSGFGFAESLPVLLAAAMTAVLVPFGLDAARIIAFSLCGYSVLRFLVAAYDFVGPFGGPDRVTETALAAAHAVAAAVVIAALGRGTVAAWFHHRRDLRAGRVQRT